MSANSNLMQLWTLLKESDPWFAKAYGEEPNPVWSASLEDFTVSELLQGYKKYLDSELNHTVRLAEFRGFCKQDKKASSFPYESRVYASRTNEQLKQGRDALDKIKEGLT